MIQNIYGIIDFNNIHTDISRTERGAKIYATKNGYTAISVRYNCGYNVQIVSVKIGNKWVNKI